MNPKLAKQFVVDARFEALEDLLAPAIAVRPRVLYASDPKRKRGRWLDWLLKTPSDGPAVATVPVFDELTLPIGVSRFDPVPDVPIGFEWPCHSDGTLLECLAQIDLAEVHREAGPTRLPSTGWLLFFAGEEAARLGSFEGRVIYVEPQPLTRWATQVPREYSARTCRLEFEPIFSLPDAHDFCVAQRMTFLDDGVESYVELQERLTDGARHYLLGYPRAIQGDVRAEAARGEADAARRRLRGNEDARLGNDFSLLLQLDTDHDGAGWMWGDAGTIYFVLHNADLAAGRFDRTRLIVQCC